MIKIGKPKIKIENDRARCYCDITIDNEKKSVWFEVDKKYEKYLTIDRTDAYVIGLLNYAMRHKHDITCECPLTDELLFNIKEILVPTLYKYSKDFYQTNIIAPTIKPCEQGEHVGTGCSCGIDSFYSIYTHINDEYQTMKLTDLCINNVGAFNECYDKYGIEETKKERYKVTQEVATKAGLNLIESDSNFFEEIYQEHSLTHTYSSCFAIYMLQKYWKTYYYASSGYDFSSFDLKDNDLNDPSHYELLSLYCFSTSSIKIYSDGGEKTRLEKTKKVIEYNLAHEYLHVCTIKPFNCGECPKCRRTLTTLDALNALENFKKVFNITEYENRKKDYYNWLWEQHYLKDEMNEPTYLELKKRKNFKVSILFKIKIATKHFLIKVKNIIPQPIKNVIKKVIGKK